MDARTRSMLNDSEQALLRETTDAKLRKLDEDALLDLHARVRRARSKYVKLHRRRGAAQVRTDKSRTRAAGAVSKNAVKAEAFEEALGRVSTRLGVVAAKAADDLREQRLAAVVEAKGGGGSASRSKGSSRAKGSGGVSAKGGSKRARSPKPIERKRAASTRSAGSRSQAKRDAR